MEYSGDSLIWPARLYGRSSEILDVYFDSVIWLTRLYGRPNSAYMAGHVSESQLSKLFCFAMVSRTFRFISYRLLGAPLCTNGKFPISYRKRVDYFNFRLNSKFFCALQCTVSHTIALFAEHRSHSHDIVGHMKTKFLRIILF